jgi:hypothetical protein
MPNKLIILAFGLSLTLSSQAQYDGQGSDEVSRFRPGAGWFVTGIRPASIEKVRKYDRLIFDICYNDWMGDIKPFQSKPNSIGFGTNLMFDKPLTKGNTISFGYGLGYKRVRISYNNFLNSNFTAKSTTFDSSFAERDRNFIYNTLYIPLEIRFRKESWKHFKVHVGGKVGYAFGEHQKTKQTSANGRTVIKDFQIYDLNHLQYSAHLRLGFRNWALFGEYGFAPIFKSSESTRLNVLRVGLSISLF